MMSRNSRTTKSRELCERLCMGSRKKWKQAGVRKKKDWGAHWTAPMLPVERAVQSQAQQTPEPQAATVSEQEYEGWQAKIRQWKLKQERAKPITKPTHPGTLPRKVICRAADVEYVRRRSGPVRVLTGEERAMALALALVTRRSTSMESPRASK